MRRLELVLYPLIYFLHFLWLEDPIDFRNNFFRPCFSWILPSFCLRNVCQCLRYFFPIKMDCLWQINYDPRTLFYSKMTHFLHLQQDSHHAYWSNPCHRYFVGLRSHQDLGTFSNSTKLGARYYLSFSDRSLITSLIWCHDSILSRQGRLWQRILFHIHHPTRIFSPLSFNFLS